VVNGDRDFKFGTYRLKVAI